MEDKARQRVGDSHDGIVSSGGSGEEGSTGQRQGREEAQPRESNYGAEGLRAIHPPRHCIGTDKGSRQVGDMRQGPHTATT